MKICYSSGSRIYRRQYKCVTQLLLRFSAAASFCHLHPRIIFPPFAFLLHRVCNNNKEILSLESYIIPWALVIFLQNPTFQHLPDLRIHGCKCLLYSIWSSLFPGVLPNISSRSFFLFHLTIWKIKWWVYRFRFWINTSGSAVP